MNDIELTIRLDTDDIELVKAIKESVMRHAIGVVDYYSIFIGTKVKGIVGAHINKVKERRDEEEDD